ncbi:MAG: fumarylacetoacetate hydrolase [Actinobacteria bacterium]|nr:fumarylacetoacetate hydrolase [Actinomycetota bacterium]
MRIARIGNNGSAPGFAAEQDGGGWVRLDALGIEAHSTADVIAARSEIERAMSGTSGADVVEDPSFLRPIVAPTKVLAIGLNYLDHIRETKSKQPERPILFGKFPNALNDPYGQIVLDKDLTERGDYEVELAVVIGQTTRRVGEADALDSVFGYTVANDISARDWQKADGQFDRSKSFDTFCPIGPWITTADEVPDPQGLALRSWVNGELRQDSSTKEMLFGVAHLIHYLSRGMTLEPGDVLLTGTPHGVGFAMEPPRYLAPGDVVECEVEGLGRLRNAVVAPQKA